MYRFACCHFLCLLEICIKNASIQAVEEGEDVHLMLVSQSFYAVCVSRAKKNLIYTTHVVQQTVKTHMSTHGYQMSVYRVY